MLNINSYRFLLVTLLILMGISFANASVVMSGSRIIYSAGEKEHSIQLTNNDNFPNAVQVWLDSGDAQSTPETGKAPFIVTPPFFRIEANAGQTLRLKYTGSGLPTDRESVFYLNFLQVPPVNKAEKNNKMLVLMRNRIKVFYRPENIAGRVDQVSSALTFNVRQQGKDVVTGKNPTGFYATIASGEVVGGGKKLKMKSEMIPPMSQAQWVIPNSSVPSNAIINFLLVNDFGGQDTGSYKTQ
ncbi:fimbrial biogenesis chaperone [Yersinia enterocolitica]|uniref:fimbrial biogenesis chaperone n=1 Tax=Yersinia enterocolitica TaxID=630 RepID=UPI0005DAEC3A|nr:molecular chaperone [Yersinia enterocolitica]CFW65124.1 putative fimbrial chaperone [Yersinia enterocolitica]CND50672.1 putative fimbrial chaperone [Yersinia enterocolitica]CNF93986.1 putative fimbrial chaperone [Yersinia enterocolitica]CNH95723.1 putative fimbrial chaperone [Yersinia enterocolitica]CNI01671.1 putative fimbrial chaperone [Yersinia enterocolitica]